MKQIVLALLGAALIAGCITEESTEEESVETSESDVIIRYIPPPMTTYNVGYFVLDDWPYGCAGEATDANILEGLRLANETWAPSNVKFALASITRIQAPHFQYLGDPTLWSGSAVTGELYQMMSMAGAGMYLWLAQSGPPRTAEDWLYWVAQHRVPQVAIYVPCAENPAVYYGHQATGNVHIPAAFVGTSITGLWLGKALGLH